MSEATKECNRCGKILPIHDFPAHKRTPDGYYGQCIHCMRDRRLFEYKAKHTPRSGYVYVIKAMDDLYKIGIADNIKTRFRMLQAQCPIPVILLYSCYFEDCVKVESELHRICKQYHSHFEWFRLPDDIVVAVIEKIKNTTDKQLPVNL